jgi:DNA polymerase-4
VKNIMMVDEARQLCRDIVLVPQKPDLYRRAHNALISEIGSVIPVDQVKSIDEVSCWLDETQRELTDLAQRIKNTIRYNIGATLTCSIGFAANRHLAKIASDTKKPDGLTIWYPEDVPAQRRPACRFDDIPGIGRSMVKRLAAARVGDAGPVSCAATQANAGAVAQCDWRAAAVAARGWRWRRRKPSEHVWPCPRAATRSSQFDDARTIARLLLVKASSTRRSNFYASALYLWLKGFERGWGNVVPLGEVQDDMAILAALGELWNG